MTFIHGWSGIRQQLWAKLTHNLEAPGTARNLLRIKSTWVVDTKGLGDSDSGQ